MRLAFLFALLALPACITGRVHVGPVVDTDGNVGFRGGVTFGLGFAGDDDKSMQIAESVSGGTIGTNDGETAGTLDATVAFDYISMPHRRGVGYRAGLRFGAHGEYADDDSGGLMVGLNTALLKPFKVNRSSGSCHEKGLDLFCWRGASWSSIGFEAELDVVHDTDDSTDKLLGYFGVVLEYDSIDD